MRLRASEAYRRGIWMHASVEHDQQDPRVIRVTIILRDGRAASFKARLAGGRITEVLEDAEVEV